jgi:hypothetical protein
MSKPSKKEKRRIDGSAFHEKAGTVNDEFRLCHLKSKSGHFSGHLKFKSRQGYSPFFG